MGNYDTINKCASYFLRYLDLKALYVGHPPSWVIFYMHVTSQAGPKIISSCLFSKPYSLKTF